MDNLLSATCILHQKVRWQILGWVYINPMNHCATGHVDYILVSAVMLLHTLAVCVTARDNGICGGRKIIEERRQSKNVDI